GGGGGGSRSGNRSRRRHLRPDQWRCRDAARRRHVWSAHQVALEPKTSERVGTRRAAAERAARHGLRLQWVALFRPSVEQPECPRGTTMHIHATGGAAPAGSIRIAVIDDHPIFREGTVGVLRGADGMEVIAEGATATDAVAIARERTPDVILLDLYLPGGGVVAAASISRDYPRVRVVALTASEDEEDV